MRSGLFALLSGSLSVVSSVEVGCNPTCIDLTDKRITMFNSEQRDNDCAKLTLELHDIKFQNGSEIKFSGGCFLTQSETASQKLVKYGCPFHDHNGRSGNFFTTVVEVLQDTTLSDRLFGRSLTLKKGNTKVSYQIDFPTNGPDTSGVLEIRFNGKYKSTPSAGDPQSAVSWLWNNCAASFTGITSVHQKGTGLKDTLVKKQYFSDNILKELSIDLLSKTVFKFPTQFAWYNTSTQFAQDSSGAKAGYNNIVYNQVELKSCDGDDPGTIPYLLCLTMQLPGVYGYIDIDPPIEVSEGFLAGGFSMTGFIILMVVVVVVIIVVITILSYICSCCKCCPCFGKCQNCFCCKFLKKICGCCIY
uniref:Uncharacterized protein n=1 Tax=Chromera velia CCMP2878 TaxID=1169474 RepID=A0A0G4G0Y6_9ALVE|eukprot:Cvel_19708.t1-p1 / transcript=Cvel_19708.t1 / gene=Cvel_19708 / organism=Chromera_velia_CCMP2878 / gene_product=hypothetical protein / transcript_product=hypothetical protein / location=Cvel_scaffold1720:38270-39699(-) / protein_length=359 / sequence_SO=supercontig / SO=protein_coding / is_pseudo=false